MPKTHFGFAPVDWNEKAGKVRGVFDRVAPKYDAMNDLMSFGLHRIWKQELICALKPHADMQMLDMAGGTGDIAFRALTKAPGMQVMLADINREMLSEGQKRAWDRNILRDIKWVCANAESLPFEDARFDAYTIAFGIRNVTDIPAALKQAHRVLKPGGKFLCLEFCDVPNEFLRKTYDAYSFNVIPKVGKLVVGDAAPYQYLVESIRQFPGAEKFRAMIVDAGFKNPRYRRLIGGMVALHEGIK